MARRRSISDIVAVMMLILIAIAAVVLIYMWLSGLIGGMRSSSGAAAMSQRAEITAVSATYSSSSGLSVIAYVFNPPGSSVVSFVSAYVSFSNGTLLCSSSSASITISPSSGISPGSSGEVSFSCPANSIPSIPSGTPIVVTLITNQGVSISAAGVVSS